MSGPHFNPVLPLPSVPLMTAFFHPLIDRYWEGRKLWSATTVTARTLARLFWFHVPDKISASRTFEDKKEWSAEERAERKKEWVMEGEREKVKGGEDFLL